MRSDQRAMAVLACFFAFLYGYFFQGGGSNPNSQFDSIRAIVERGTIDITPYADNTGDKGEYKGLIYSNKLPGLAFAGAPFYWVAYHAERLLEADPNSLRIVTLNQYLLTFILSGVPGVALLLVLFRHFRRHKATLYEAFYLAAAFGTGSLLLPYSGVLMNHVLTACLLFTAWHIISAAQLPLLSATAAGVIAGLAVLTDSLAAPAAGLFVLYLAVQRWQAVGAFLSGAAPVALVLLAYDYLCFDSVLSSNHSIEADVFKHPGYRLGVFYWPEPIRLYWLTFHPFRGLFYSCPILVIALLSLPWPLWPLRAWKLSWEQAIPLLIVGYHFLFNVSFNGWTGGWSVGPRYLIPALPFLYSFALTGYRRFRALFGLLAALSTVFMVSVTAVLVLRPAADTGPPPAAVPVFDSLLELLAGRISVSFFPVPGYNLGELASLTGLWSLIPAALAFLVVFGFGYNLRRHERAAG